MKKFLTEKELNERCDELLTDMYRGAKFNGTKKEEGFDIDYVSISRMNNDGYAEVNWMIDGETRWRAKITPFGIEFIASGGYMAKRRKEAISRRWDNIRYWITTAIALGAAVLAILK